MRNNITSCIVPLAWRNIIEHFQFSHLDNQTNFPIQFSDRARKNLSRGSDWMDWMSMRMPLYEISEWVKLYARWSSFNHSLQHREKCKYVDDFMQKILRTNFFYYISFKFTRILRSLMIYNNGFIRLYHLTRWLFQLLNFCLIFLQ